LEHRLKTEDEKPYILVDVSNFIHRKFHVVKKVYGEENRGRILYFFFSDMVKLKEVFKNGKLIFCFDSHTSLRKRIQKKYKESSEDSDEKQKIKRIINFLRLRVLPLMGFKNILMFEDLEADDVIGAITTSSRSNGRVFVICSNDKDMFQLLKKNVFVYRPDKKEIISDKVFKENYNDLPPKDWAMVKALVGKTGEVDGVDGVGIKTAIKFLTGGNVSEKTKDKIASEKEKISEMLVLSKLPIKPIRKRFRFKTDLLTDKKIDLGLRRAMSIDFFDNQYLDYLKTKFKEGINNDPGKT
jgi:5'-3' exonuclease